MVEQELGYLCQHFQGVSYFVFLGVKGLWLFRKKLENSFNFFVLTLRLMQVYLTTVGKGKAHGTYYLARQDPETGNQYISLVSQEDINGNASQLSYLRQEFIDSTQQYC